MTEFGERGILNVTFEEKGGLFLEKKIYLVLTQTTSFLARTIKIFTGSEFNHASLSLSPTLDPMWSFGRRHPYNPFWGGFVQEFQFKGTFHRFPKTHCAVLELGVEEAVYEKMERLFKEMYENRESYGYNFLGLCLAAMNVGFQVENKYYCSEFIKAIFQDCSVPGAEKIPKIAEPSYFLNFPGTRVIYRGLLKNYPATKKA